MLDLVKSATQLITSDTTKKGAQGPQESVYTARVVAVLHDATARLLQKRSLKETDKAAEPYTENFRHTSDELANSFDMQFQKMAGEFKDVTSTAQKQLGLPLDIQERLEKELVTEPAPRPTITLEEAPIPEG